MRGASNNAMRLEEDLSSQSDVRDSDESEPEEGIRGLSTDQMDEYGEVVNVETEKKEPEIEIPDDSCWNQFLRMMRGNSTLGWSGRGLEYELLACEVGLHVSVLKSVFGKIYFYIRSLDIRSKEDEKSATS